MSDGGAGIAALFFSVTAFASVVRTLVLFGRHFFRPPHLPLFLQQPFASLNLPPACTHSPSRPLSPLSAAAALFIFALYGQPARSPPLPCLLLVRFCASSYLCFFNLLHKYAAQFSVPTLPFAMRPFPNLLKCQNKPTPEDGCLMSAARL